MQKGNTVILIHQNKENKMVIETKQSADRLAIGIVNLINAEFNLNLLTVDSAAMSELVSNKLYALPEQPKEGRRCKVMIDGVLLSAVVVECIGEETYTAVIIGTGVKMSNIPFSIWRPQ